MVRIFISYSRQNIDAAKFIATELVKYGAEVFIDYESAGRRYFLDKAPTGGKSNAATARVLFCQRAIDCFA